MYFLNHNYGISNHVTKHIISACYLQVILLLIILVMRKRIGLVVALFKEAGKCIASMPCLLVQPIWTFIMLLGFFMYWVIVLAFLSTSGKYWK